MIIKGNLKVGGASLQFEAMGEDTQEIVAMQKVIALCNPRKKCNLCSNEDPDEFEMYSNMTEKYTFVKINCLKCRGVSQLGRYHLGGYFWKEFKQYIKGKKETPAEEK